MENKKVNWYPGHMFKAKKEVQQQLKQVDGIIEVIDARVPISSHNEMLEELTKNKAKLVIFSKADLVDPQSLRRYQRYYEERGYQVYATNIMNNSYRDKLLAEIEKLGQDVVAKYEEKNMHKTLRLLVIGMPNVGKSSLINMLASRKKAVVGNRPGVTKRQEVIRINDDIELLDTPGILVPKIDRLETGYNLVLNSLIKDEVVELEDIAFYLLKYLVNNGYETQLEDRYKKLTKETVESFKEDPQELVAVEQLYTEIGQSSGYYKNNEGPDYERISVMIINDYRKQKFGKIILDELDEKK